MKQEILEKTYQLVDEIKAQDMYKRLLELQKEVSSNNEIIALINTFQKLNTKYEETAKYGKYHPDLKRVQIEFSKAKEDLYTNPIIKEYKQLEKELQKQLDQVSSEIAKAISKKIKHPNEFGLINKY